VMSKVPATLESIQRGMSLVSIEGLLTVSQVPEQPEALRACLCPVQILFGCNAAVPVRLQ
jgi:hypothetical protein